MIIKILFLFGLIAVNAFFAASEMALISLNDNKIKLMADSGNKKAKQLAKLLSEPSRFLATIQIGITFAGFLASAFAAESFADPIVIGLQGFHLPISESLLKVMMIIVITIILSYFTLVLGELVPKRIAMKKYERIAFFVVSPLTFLSKVTNPFVKVLTASTNFIVRLFGMDPHSIEDDVTEEEIRMMVGIGEEKGVIDDYEKRMINNIFEFNNKTAEDIMTHRIEVVGISADSTLISVMTCVKGNPYSRIPVYEDSMDNIIGVLHIKDLLGLIIEHREESFEWVKFIRKPFFTPLQKKINELFLELQVAETRVAIVIDEYGGTAGIVTIEDLVEEIVGNIFDEYDDADDRELKQLDAVTFEVSGLISLAELEASLDVDLPKDNYDTLNGFLISLFGKLPPKDQISEVRYRHLLFQIIEVTNKRIEKAIIRIESHGDDSQLIEE